MKDASADGMLNQSVLGRYRIVRKLASGGMGAVYLARTEGAEGFARPVVVKRVLPALMGDPEVAQLFVREARILANLQHPNIVSVVDFGQQEDGAYVTVFEYVNGYSLAEWQRYVKRTRGLVPADVALYIVARVLDALHYAHTFRRRDGKPMGIIHRDVSPTNVLLGEQATVKLLDFGIAHVSGDRSETAAGPTRIRGKLPYLPAEVFRGEQATIQSDLYSAGVVLYELLAGFNPFSGREIREIHDKVMTVTPPSVHSARDDAPEDVDEVLTRALDRDPKRRFQSAAEFIAAVRSLRCEPDELVTQQLASDLRRDFQALPQLLGVDDLAAREAAWRTSGAPSPGAEFDPLAGPTLPPVAIELAADAADAVTVHAEISPALLVAAREAPAEAAPAAGGHRVAWIAALAALVGAIAAAGVWMMMFASAPQPVLVIQPPHVSSAQAAAAVAALAPPPAAEPPANPPAAPAEPPAQLAADEAAAHREQAEAGNSAAERDKREAPAPSPRALTRAFERRHDRVEACFVQHAAGLQGEPELSVHFRVGTAGQVLLAELQPAALAGTSLGRCLLDVARTTRFRPQQRELSFRIPITARKAGK